MPTLTKLFSMQEAAQHNTKDDCWVVIGGKCFAPPLCEGIAVAVQMVGDMYSCEGWQSQSDACPPPYKFFLTVYDVTSYLDEHPGGDDVILIATGKDATDEFEDAGHSEDARDLMEKFCVGELDPSAATIPAPVVSSSNQADIIQKMKDLPLQYWAVPLAVAGISVAVGFLYLRRK